MESVGAVTLSSKDKDYETVMLNLKGDPYVPTSVQENPKLSDTLSGLLNKAGIVPSNHYWIGGETSSAYDRQTATARDSHVIGLIALLPLLYLRSIIAMAYLIVTVLLSYFSALGAGWILLHYGMGTSAISIISRGMHSCSWSH